MRISVDTNVLLSLVVPGDAAQRIVAIETPRAAEPVAISLHVLCELVWVLQRTYDAPRAEIAASIRLFMDTPNVVLNRPAVEAGLSVLVARGDFADGAIAYEGACLGGETFVSFDRKAVRLLTLQGYAARLLE